MAQTWQVSFAEARSRLADQLAAIELFPYHSAAFRDADHWLTELPSVQLAREFVGTRVVERVDDGKAIVVVTRQTRLWGLTEIPDRVVLYSAAEARGAHLSPDSRGGKAILKHLVGS
jgi:hypothetical protein